MDTSVALLPKIPVHIFDHWAKRFKPPIVDNSTAPHYAGYLLGIQYVLGELRKELVSQ